MKNEFINTKICDLCGASIASHLQNCPYCKNILPADDLLPYEVHEKVKAKFLKIENKLYKLKYGDRASRLYNFALIRIALIPILLSIITYIVFKSWILAIIILVSAGIISYLRKDPAYHFYFLSYRLEKKMWHKKYQTKIDEIMMKHDADDNAYKEVVLDILSKNKYIDNSPLVVVLDPVDE